MKVIFGRYPLSNASNAYWMNLIHNSKKVLKNPKVIEKLNKNLDQNIHVCLALNNRKKRKLGI
jgi:hypothetical protein